MEKKELNSTEQTIVESMFIRSQELQRKAQEEVNKIDAAFEEYKDELVAKYKLSKGKVWTFDGSSGSVFLVEKDEEPGEDG